MTLELDPIKFLDTEIIRSNSKITTQLSNKMKKLPAHCTSKIPVRYKRNSIIGELHRAKKIASKFDMEIKCIVNKYTAVGFPSRFVHSIIDNFDSSKDNLIISQWLFDERKAFTIHIPFSPSNESFVKTFVSKLNYFTNEKWKFNVVWNTRKVQSLFPLKDKVSPYSCVIYWGIVLVTKIILERQFVMLKYDGMNMKTKTANLNQQSIYKRTQLINLDGPSAARLLRTFVSAEY